jgi:hypothetical protein
VLAFGLILGSAAVAAALAFGLGGRETAGKLLSQWTQGGQRITPASTDRRPPPPPPFEPEPRPFQAGQPESGV